MNWLKLFYKIWNGVSTEYDAEKNEAPMSPNGKFGVCAYGNILINMGNIDKLLGEFCAIICNSEGCQVLVKYQNFDLSISKKLNEKVSTKITNPLKSIGTVTEVL